MDGEQEVQQQEQEEVLQQNMQQGTEQDGTADAAVDSAENEAENSFAMFETDTVKVQPRPKDAHRGTILAITANKYDSGATMILVHLRSSDTSNDDELSIFVPPFFVDNCEKFFKQPGQAKAEFGIENLPAGEPDPMEPTKIKGNQRATFGMAIRNSDGNAAVQNLLSIAAKWGRNPRELGIVAPPKSFDEYVGQLNTLMAEVNVVYTRLPQKNEDNPQFNGRLKVRGIFFPSDILDNEKSLKGYVKQWIT